MALKTYTSATIRGITYNKGDKFTCYYSAKGNGGSEGDGGSAAALTKGATYYFLGYVVAADSGSTVKYPYKIGSSSTTVRGFYKEEVFPYATYKVTYNANGGSNAPAVQTKTYGTALTLTSEKPTMTGYTFKSWNTKANGTGTSYAAGASYKINAAITLYAVWTANSYTVTYNANGGSGAPEKQTKTHGTALTLSNTEPTRTNYTFKGWGTSATTKTVSYAAGASYTNNATITLYAIWELSYTKPRVTNLKVYRCDSSGAFKDDGTDMRIDFAYETDKGESPTVEWSWKASTSSVWEATYTPYDANADKIIAHATYQHSEHAGKIDLEKAYDWQIKVSDSGGSTIITGTVQSLNLAIDVMPPKSNSSGDNAKYGVAIGKTAENRGVFDIGLKAKFGKGYISEVLTANNGAGVDLDAITTPGWYVGANKTTYTNQPPGLSGTFTLEVMNAGVDDAGNYIQLMQRITRCSTDPLEYVRHYFSGDWQPWVRKFGVSLYSDSKGSSGVITLKDHDNKGELVDADLSKFKSIEIYYTDNNGKGGGYTKIHSPQGKEIELHCLEAGSDTNTYIRRTRFTLDGSTITPNTDTAAYFIAYTSGTIGAHIKGQLIKIYKVIGYEYEM